MLPVNFRHFVIACALALLACTANATYTLGSRNASHTYDSATNRLQSINTNGVYTGFSYDAQGNTTAKGSQGYYFDQANRLLLIPGIARYSYDALGRRVFSAALGSSINNRTSVYSQAGLGSPVARSNGAGTLISTTAY